MYFSPTYLYIKQHSITGKLYFGKTSKSESTMLLYKGSGKRWINHITYHGKSNVITLWYQLYDNLFDLVADALSMSKSFDIINNKTWLNIIEENGLSGAPLGSYKDRIGVLSPTYGRVVPYSQKIKMSLTRRMRSGEQNINSYSRVKSKTEIDKISKSRDILVCKISNRKVMTIANFYKHLNKKSPEQNIKQIEGTKILVCRIRDKKVMTIGNFFRWK